MYTLSCAAWTYENTVCSYASNIFDGTSTVGYGELYTTMISVGNGKISAEA
jgi:hypothetical protein